MIQSYNRVIIDLSALVHNLTQVKKLVGRKTKIMGVVKSDAYGHGMVPVSRVLEENGIDSLGVAFLHEALELREKGLKSPIVILCGIETREDAREVVDKNLTTVLYDLSPAEALAEACDRSGKRIRIHLKVDTGMGRLGIPDSDLLPLMRKIKALKPLYLEALTSHLSSADETEKTYTKDQIKRFTKAIEIGRTIGLELPLNNLANSAGIMAHKDSHFDMVRPGIMLYGGLPSPQFRTPTKLKQVMHFKGRILQIRDFPDHTPVSYGRTYFTKGRQNIAVLSAGYGDGLHRSVSNRGKVLAGGEDRDIVGRVCMNMTMANVSGMKDVVAGQEVVFLGEQGNGRITGDELAGWAETISYEIFCSIGQKNVREYTQ
jgi:alanine racemase